MIEAMGYTFVSFYFSPNDSTIEFSKTLNKLENSIAKYKNNKIIIGGNFNSRSTI